MAVRSRWPPMAALSTAATCFGYCRSLVRIQLPRPRTTLIMLNYPTATSPARPGLRTWSDRGKWPLARHGDVRALRRHAAYGLLQVFASTQDCRHLPDVGIWRYRTRRMSARSADGCEAAQRSAA